MIRIKSVSIFRGLTSGLPTGRVKIKTLINTIIQVKIETFLFYKYWLQKQPTTRFITILQPITTINRWHHSL